MFEYFSAWQCLFFIIVTKLLETVKHCVTTKAFRKTIENDEDFKEWIMSKHDKEGE